MPPKRSIADAVFPLLRDGKIDEAVATARELKSDGSYRLDQREIEAIGKRYMEERKAMRAIDYFTLNIRLFPQSARAHVSLGKGYASQLNINEAKKSFLKALEIDPSNAEAKRLLKRFGVDVE